MELSASKLRDRIRLQKASQTPDPVTGGFTRGYETLIEIWAEVKPLTHGSYVRGVQTETKPTHEINIRRLAVHDLLVGSFSRSFSSAFKKVDVHPIKAEDFIFVPRGSSGSGDLYRVRRVMEVGASREQLSFLCEELEEQGSG